jgi:hypothetical protein
VLSSKEIGEWRYLASGVGSFPDKEMTSYLVTQLGETAASNIVFRNPFREEIAVSVVKTGGPEFEVELRKGKHYQLASCDSIEIPVKFTPTRIGVYRCVVSFVLSEHLSWKHAIEGQVETESVVLSEPFHTRCKEETHKLLTIDLKSLNEEIIDSSEFTAELINFKPQLEGQILRAVSLQINRKTIFEPVLTVHVKFLPHKPFSTSASILIKRRTGGIWKYRAFFEAVLPEYDGEIVLRHEGDRPVSSSFELASTFELALPFEAYFNEEAAADFTVSPKKGLLKGKDGGPNVFTVSFRDLNSRYNVNAEADLIIEVEDFIWLFKVIAIVPKYKPPEGGPKTDTWGVRNMPPPPKRNFLL